MARNNVKIVITVDDKGSPIIKSFASKAKGDLGGVEQKAVAGAKSMRAAWLTAAAALAAVTAGIYSMAEAVKAMETQRRAVEGMETVFRSMGRTAPGLSDRMQDLAIALQQVTNFGDEATLEGVKFLGTYKGIADDLLPRTTKAMLDLAAATGRDVVSAANMLGKASMGMTGELRRVGITVDAETFKLKGYAGLLGEIERQFGGQAEIMSDPWTRLGNAVGDGKENLGGFVNVAFSPFAEDMISLLGHTTEKWKSLSERIRETQRIELQYMLTAIERQLKTGAYTAGMGGIGVDFEIPDELSDDQRAALERKAERIQQQMNLLLKKPLPGTEGDAGGDGRRTKEEAQAIELQERAIEQATLLAEEKLRIWIERNNAEVEAERLKEEQIAEMRAESVLQHKAAAEAKLNAETARVNAEIAAEKRQIEADKQMTKQWMEQSLAMAASQNKKAWRLYQAYRLSEAIVDTIEAAQASYRWGASWGGPIGGAAMAALATVAGAMRVAAIAKEKPQAREGGVFTGPSSGYGVELHGTEAVVPLPGGRGIPVEAAGGGGIGTKIDLTIVATDAKSFAELTESNPEAIVGPLMNALQVGHRGLTTTIKETTQTN